jgi:hypothetical protein
LRTDREEVLAELTAPARRAPSGNFLAPGRLIRQEKSFDEIPFSASRHSGNLLVPGALWNFRLAIQPLGQQLELGSVDSALLNSLEQVPEQDWRDVLATNARQTQIP